MGETNLKLRGFPFTLNRAHGKFIHELQGEVKLLFIVESSTTDIAGGEFYY